MKYSDELEQYRPLQAHRVKVIYGLIDPRDNQIYYIGKSHHPFTRFSVWLSVFERGHSYHKNEALNKWLESLRAEWLRPRIIILEKLTHQVTKQFLAEREADWICKGINVKWPLTNIQTAQRAKIRLRFLDAQKRTTEPN